jgi:hypothetical protein
MVIKHDNLANCPWVLELQDRFLLHTQYHNVFASHTNLVLSGYGNIDMAHINSVIGMLGCSDETSINRTYSAGSLSDSLTSIFDLEETDEIGCLGSNGRQCSTDLEQMPIRREDSKRYRDFKAFRTAQLVHASTLKDTPRS